MIISQALLISFVVYWLIGRFNAEKELLDNELRREFAISEDKMLDSLLMEKLSPLIKLNRNTQANKRFDEIGKDTTSTKIITLHNRSDEKNLSLEYHDSNLISIHINKFSRDTTGSKVYINADREQSGKINIEGSAPNPDDIFIRSFKLFIEQTDDSDSSRSVANITSDSLDASILIADFKSKLFPKNLDIIWIDSVQFDSTQEGTLFYYESSYNNILLGAEIKGSGLYTIKKIISNILFALVLLILTSVAFIVSFISLKKQVILNELRDGFVSNISHELNTPVSTVKVALEALDQYNLKKDPVAASEYIQMARKEVNRLDNLIQKILISSAFDEDNSLLNIEKVDLKELITEVIQDMHLRLQQEDANIEIKINCENTIVNADRLHLQGVIINLLDNSLKYSVGKTAINISIDKMGSAVVLSVADNGVGIPKEYLPKVFDKFFRVPTGDKHNVKGYGLGLNYVAMVMDRLKGSVKVKNNPDGGCTFTLTFLDY